MAHRPVRVRLNFKGPDVWPSLIRGDGRLSRDRPLEIDDPVFACIWNLLGHVGFGDLVRGRTGCRRSTRHRLFSVHAHELHVRRPCAVLEPMRGKGVHSSSSLAGSVSA